MSGEPTPAPADGGAKKLRWRLPRWSDTAFLLLGLALLVWVLSRYPMGDIGRACLRLGPWVALTPVAALGWIACNTSALHLLLDGQVPWLRLFEIRLVGDGYNALLPLAGMGGEPYKLKHISRFVAADRVLTALVRDRVMENGVGLLFTAAWLAVSLAHFSLPQSMRVAIPVYVLVASAVGLASVLLMCTTLPGRASAVLARWFGVPSQSAVILPPGRLVGVLLWFLAARVVGLLEGAILLWLLGLGCDPLTIGFFYSMHNAAGTIGFAVPAGLGVFEATTVYLFSLLGYPGPLGVAFAFARRGRMLLVGLLGVALHLMSSLLHRERSAQVSTESGAAAAEREAG